MVAHGVAAAFEANREAHDSLPIALLITIGRRGAIDWVRRTRRPKRGIENSSNDPLTRAIPLDEFVLTEGGVDDEAIALAEVRLCLDSIGESIQGRDLLIFNRLRDGVSQKDIAAELGVSRARTSQLVQRMVSSLQLDFVDGAGA